MSEQRIFSIESAGIGRNAALVRLLMDVAVSSNEAPDVHAILKFVLRRVCVHTGWPVGHAYMLASDFSGDLISARTWHLPPGDRGERYASLRTVSEQLRFSPGMGLPGRVLASGKATWVADVTIDDNFPRAKLATDLGVRAGFAFPIRIGNEIVGALEFFSEVAHEPDEGLLEVMAIVGTQIGRVVERKRATEIQDRLLAIVSHDLRSPLSALMLLANRLGARDTAGSSEQLGRKMLQIGARMDDIIGDLLDYAEARNARGLRIEKSDIDLDDICRGAIHEAAATHDGREILYEHRGETHAEGDAGRLRQMVDNLLHNALKYGSPTEPIVVRCSGDADQLRLSIQNQGEPIPRDLLTMIFEPFQRPSNRTGKDGLGLGLFIINAIAHAHRGSVTVTSTAEEGTTFEVRLAKHAVASAPSARFRVTA